jgi:RNA polymerase sigma factor (sigma-70 family)
VAEGALAGFDERFEDLWAISYQVAFKILGDREGASDVAQEALTKTAFRWERVSDYAPAFVARVAGQRAVDMRRRHGRKAVLDPGRPDERFPIEERDVLITALRRLPNRQRQVVILRYLGDISEVDTARALGCSQGTVKQHSSRGLAALRAILTAATKGA